MLLLDCKQCCTFVDTVVGVSSGKSFRGVMNVMNTDISKYQYYCVRSSDVSDSESRETRDSQIFLNTGKRFS